MNVQEVAKVLTKIQAIDNRQVDELVLAAWVELIGNLEFSDALEGVNLHRLEKPGVWLEPGHVVAGARRAREARLRVERRNRPAIERKAVTLDRVEFDRITVEAAEEWRRVRGVSGG